MFQLRFLEMLFIQRIAVDFFGLVCMKFKLMWFELLIWDQLVNQYDLFNAHTNLPLKALKKLKIQHGLSKAKHPQLKIRTNNLMLEREFRFQQNPKHRLITHITKLSQQLSQINHALYYWVDRKVNSCLKLITNFN